MEIKQQEKHVPWSFAQRHSRMTFVCCLLWTARKQVPCSLICGVLWYIHPSECIYICCPLLLVLQDKSLPF